MSDLDARILAWSKRAALPDTRSARRIAYNETIRQAKLVVGTRRTMELGTAPVEYQRIMPERIAESIRLFEARLVDYTFWKDAYRPDKRRILR